MLLDATVKNTMVQLLINIVHPSCPIKHSNIMAPLKRPTFLLVSQFITVLWYKHEIKLLFNIHTK